MHNPAKPDAPPPPPPRTSNGIELDPRLPEPVAGLDYQPKILDSTNPNIANSHINGYISELKLANEIANLPGQQVLKYGDAIGRNGSDVISVDIRTGEVTLWDSKYRSSDVTLGISPTFSRESAFTAAIEEAKRVIFESSLPVDIREKSIIFLNNRTLTTNTVAAGNARNSVQVKFSAGNMTSK